VGMGQCLVTIKEAARALGVSERHIKRLIHEADVDRKSLWRHGREIINLSTRSASRRTLRINLNAIIPAK
jgi:hypothetical protein